MPHLLRDVMILNNDCLQDMLRIPDEPERLINAFRILQHALRMLRNDASLAMMEFKSPHHRGPPPPPRGRRVSPVSPQHGYTLIPSERRFSFPSYTNEFESNPGTDVYYSYDRPLLFHFVETSSTTSSIECNNYDEMDLDTMNFVCATVLFNLALICHRYAMTQSEGTRSDLLLNSRKLYRVLIDLLIDITTTNTASTTPQPVTNDGSEVQATDDILLLLTLTYHCLGHLYYELGMLADSSECMMKLHHVFMSQRDCSESFRLRYFHNIIDEIKLNIVFWKMYAPAPIAIAA